MSKAATMEDKDRATVHVAAYLRPSQAESLRALAAAQDRPVAYLIRTAIDRLLSEAGL